MTPDLSALVERAIELCTTGRAVLGIAGAPGSGKSGLAARLLAEVASLEEAGPGAVACVPMDGFHLADRQLDAQGLRDRKGAPETFDAVGYAAMLLRLRDEKGTTVYAPAFERDLEQPLAGAIAVGPDVRLVITEGNYLLLDDGPWAPVRDLLTEAWFVQVDDDERVRRLVTRHERYGKSRERAADWVATVDEPNARLVVATRHRADLVVDLDPIDGQPSLVST